MAPFTKYVSNFNMVTLQSTKIFGPARLYKRTSNWKYVPNAKFTKVETGSDGFAADFAKGWVCPDGFGLQTGFDSELKDICQNDTLLQRR